MQFETPLLVVAAHPDDEVIGAGGTLARLHGTVLVLCRPHTKGRLETGRSDAASAAQARIMSQFPWVSYVLEDFEDEQLELAAAVDAIELVVGRLEPATVICPSWHDMNQDHRIVAEATAIACRLSRRRHLRALMTMEIPSSSDQGIDAPDAPDLFVGIQWADKAAMLEAYGSELLASDRSPDVLEALARVRGATVGEKHAEAFGLVRAAFRAE
jgi:N-acetylglucosamine malate deacetylase 1